MDRERVAAYKQRPLQEALVDAAAGFLAASAPPDEEAAMDAELAASVADAGGRGAVAGAGDTPGNDGPSGPPPDAEVLPTASRRDSATGHAAAAAGGPAAAAEPGLGQPQAGGEPAELRRQLARVGLRARFYFTKARQLEAALARQAAAGARLRRANEALSARLAAALAAAAAAPEGGPSAAPELTAAMGPGVRPGRVSAVVVIPAMQAGARPRAASAPSATGRVVVVRPPEPASTAAGEPEVDGAEAAGPEPMPGPDEGLADMMQGPGHAATRGPRLSLDAATLTLNPGEDPLASQTSLEWVEGLMRAPSQGSQPELHLAALGAAAGAAAAGRPPGAPAALALPGLAQLPAGAAPAGDPAEVDLPMAVLCASQDPAPGAPDPPPGDSPSESLAFDAAPVPAALPGAGSAQAAVPEEQTAGGMEGLEDARSGLGSGTPAVASLADAPGTAGGRGSNVGAGPRAAVSALGPGGAGSGRGLLAGWAAAERAERRGSGSPRLLLVSRRAARLALLRIRLHARPWRAPGPWLWSLCWRPRSECKVSPARSLASALVVVLARRIAHPLHVRASGLGGAPARACHQRPRRRSAKRRRAGAQAVAEVRGEQPVVVRPVHSLGAR